MTGVDCWDVDDIRLQLSALEVDISDIVVVVVVVDGTKVPVYN